MFVDVFLKGTVFRFIRGGGELPGYINDGSGANEAKLGHF